MSIWKSIIWEIPRKSHEIKAILNGFFTNPLGCAVPDELKKDSISDYLMISRFLS
jgi:hypothetical protein